MKSPNFGFLVHLDASLGAHAELLFSVDPVASLVRLRLLGERLTKELAAHAGIRLAELDSQASHIELLRARGLLHPDVAHLFHGLRKSGNQAAHDGVGSASEALHQMKICRRLGLAVLETLGRMPPGFKLGPFVPPAAPKDASEGLRSELDDLRKETESLTQAHAEALEAANLERALREDYERRVAELEQKVAETEAAFDELAASRELEVQHVTTAVAQQSAPNLQRVFESLTQNATRAAAHLDLDEAETRGLVDRQLRDAGWEADTPTLRHSLGTRSVPGRNLAIAEWPTDQGPADYALFVGLRLVALVEAKRIAKSVVGALEQARRYARGVRFDGAELLGRPGQRPTDLAESYADGTDTPPRVPFVFATNGRPYLKQIVEESGIWFHDLRRPQNHPRALPSCARGMTAPQWAHRAVEQAKRERVTMGATRSPRHPPTTRARAVAARLGMTRSPTWLRTLALGCTWSTSSRSGTTSTRSRRPTRAVGKRRWQRPRFSPSANSLRGRDGSAALGARPFAGFAEQEGRQTTSTLLHRSARSTSCSAILRFSAMGPEAEATFGRSIRARLPSPGDGRVTKSCGMSPTSRPIHR